MHVLMNDNNKTAFLEQHSFGALIQFERGVSSRVVRIFQSYLIWPVQYIVTWRLKAGIAEPERKFIASQLLAKRSDRNEQSGSPLLANDSPNVPTATNRAEVHC
jgi:hypothetical protein